MHVKRQGRDSCNRTNGFRFARNRTLWPVCCRVRSSCRAPPSLTTAGSPRGIQRHSNARRATRQSTNVHSSGNRRGTRMGERGITRRGAPRPAGRRRCAATFCGATPSRLVEPCSLISRVRIPERSRLVDQRGNLGFCGKVWRRESPLSPCLTGFWQIYFRSYYQWVICHSCLLLSSGIRYNSCQLGD